jgi:hypothetical protein
MAKGDVVSNIATVATTANLDYQPAAGVEAMITELFSSVGATDQDAKLYDGSLSAQVADINYTALKTGPFRILVNNTRYLRLTNANASSREMGWCGIQTK